MSQILVVDDEMGIRELLSEILGEEGHEVRLAESAGEARALRNRARPDLVLLDIWMPDTDGITLLKEWATTGQLTMPVVMMSGHGTIDTAVEATRMGAYAFLEKPIALQKLLSTVGQALRQQPSAPAASQLLPAYLGKAAVVGELRQRMEALKSLKLPLLIVGEPGAGKRTCARALHQPNTAWVEPEDYKVLDDPFGDLARQAAEGTLFIREIADLGTQQQRNLLALMPSFERAHTRVIASTARELPRLAAEGRFDPRLAAAIAQTQLRVPSLREHAEDIPELARLMLSRLVEARAVPPRTLSTAALNALRVYDWPGNLTQLETSLRSMALLTPGNELGVSDVNIALAQVEGAQPGAFAGLRLDSELRDARDAFERIYFEYHIAREGANMSKVAERVGLERTHLYRKLKQLGIKLNRREQ
ncbi:MAG: sigma-54-dependent Fis family transcriptional regulator [Burkholderiales bacterium]|nr:sigma-54-dependent Fis family transcriptional regulator [Burkholderiales bacterium]